jgi:hypothetical protein
MGKRYYDTVTGRFLSRERLWPRLDRPRALNPYQYALENPVKYMDPEGTDEMTPREYAQWRVYTAISSGQDMNDPQIDADIKRYASEWVVRNVGDPEKYELTPKQYAEWRMLQAPSITGREDAEELQADIERYAREWDAVRNKFMGNTEAMIKFGKRITAELLPW